MVKVLAGQSEQLMRRPDTEAAGSPDSLCASGDKESRVHGAGPPHPSPPPRPNRQQQGPGNVERHTGETQLHIRLDQDVPTRPSASQDSHYALPGIGAVFGAGVALECSGGVFRVKWCWGGHQAHTCTVDPSALNTLPPGPSSSKNSCTLSIRMVVSAPRNPPVLLAWHKHTRSSAAVHWLQWNQVSPLPCKRTAWDVLSLTRYGPVHLGSDHFRLMTLKRTQSAVGTTSALSWPRCLRRAWPPCYSHLKPSFLLLHYRVRCFESLFFIFITTPVCVVVPSPFYGFRLQEVVNVLHECYTFRQWTARGRQKNALPKSMQVNQECSGDRIGVFHSEEESSNTPWDHNSFMCHAIRQCDPQPIRAAENGGTRFDEQISPHVHGGACGPCVDQEWQILSFDPDEQHRFRRDRAVQVFLWGVSILVDPTVPWVSSPGDGHLPCWAISPRPSWTLLKLKELGLQIFNGGLLFLNFV
eukprot:superscaffoldBa00005869_g20874